VFFFPFSFGSLLKTRQDFFTNLPARVDLIVDRSPIGLQKIFPLLSCFEVKLPLWLEGTARM